MRMNPTEPAAEPEIKGALGTRDDIYEILIRQHNEAKNMLSRLSGASADNAEDARELRTVGRRLAIELIAHDEAESQTLYKQLMEFDDIRAHVERHQREHEETNAQLTVLLNAGAGDDEWLEAIGQIRKAVEAHIEDEENKLFPQAQKRLDGREARALGDAFSYLHDLRKNLMPTA